MAKTQKRLWIIVKSNLKSMLWIVTIHDNPSNILGSTLSPSSTSDFDNVDHWDGAFRIHNFWCSTSRLCKTRGIRVI